MLFICTDEILHSNKANWLSDDGRYVAYLQFNDSNVPLATVTLFGDASDTYSHTIGVLYPKVINFNTKHSTSMLSWQ